MKKILLAISFFGIASLAGAETTVIIIPAARTAANPAFNGQAFNVDRQALMAERQAIFNEQMALRRAEQQMRFDERAGNVSAASGGQADIAAARNKLQNAQQQYNTDRTIYFNDQANRSSFLWP